MKWIAAVLVIAGCQRGRGETAAPVSPEYREDIAALCDSVRLSGAGSAMAGDRPNLIAMWLAGRPWTKEGHAFLVAVQPLEGDAHAAALEAEAARVGLSGCALAAEWRSPK